MCVLEYLDMMDLMAKEKTQVVKSDGVNTLFIVRPQ